METLNQTKVSYAWLRRVCQRIPEVAPQYAGDPALATQTPLLLQAAEGFASETDALATAEANTRAAMEEVSAKVNALYGRMRIWFAPLSRDMTGFVASEYTDKSTIAEDVIADALRLVDTVAGYHDGQGKLPYAEALVADLESALEPAEAAWKAALVARTETASRQAAQHLVAAVLNRELVVYRRMLRRTIGAKHLHYRMLRMPGRSDAEPPDVTEVVTTESAVAAPSNGKAAHVG